MSLIARTILKHMSPSMLLSRLRVSLSENQEFAVFLASIFLLKMGMMVYAPVNDFERLFFIKTSELMTQLKYPYLSYYPAYPPFGTLLIMTLAIISHQNNQLLLFMTRALSVLFSAGSTTLIYLIMKEISKDMKLSLASSMIYNASFVALWSTQHALIDNLTAFLMLLAVHYTLKRKPITAALFVGLGTMTKVIPIILLLPILKVADSTKRKIYAILVVGSIAFGLSAYFLATNPSIYLSTYMYGIERGPWETIWAVIDGYYGSGASLLFDLTFIPISELKVMQQDWDVITKLTTGTFQTFYSWRYPLLKTTIGFGLISVELLLLRLHKVRSSREILDYVISATLAYYLFAPGFSTGWEVFYSPFIILFIRNPQQIFITMAFYCTTIMDHIYYFQGFLGLVIPGTAGGYLFGWSPARIMLIVSTFARATIYIFLLCAAAPHITTWKGRFRFPPRLTRKRLIIGLAVGLIMITIGMSRILPAAVTDEDTPRMLIRDQLFSMTISPWHVEYDFIGFNHSKTVLVQINPNATRVNLILDSLKPSIFVVKDQKDNIFMSSEIGTHFQASVDKRFVHGDILYINVQDMSGVENYFTVWVNEVKRYTTIRLPRLGSMPLYTIDTSINSLVTFLDSEGQVLFERTGRQVNYIPPRTVEELFLRISALEDYDGIFTIWVIESRASDIGDRVLPFVVIAILGASLFLRNLSALTSWKDLQ